MKEREHPTNHVPKATSSVDLVNGPALILPNTCL